MKSCAIVQSNYIPWKGYFDLINMVDEFVLFDCVQYTRRDWRNRNRIKTAREVAWLTVPVQSKGNFEAPIDSILIDEAGWAERHWQTITHNYAKAACFSEYATGFQTTYESLAKMARLSEVNRILIEQICRNLEIQTRITDSRIYKIADGKSERLMRICQQVGADVYYSGPAAKGYLDEAYLKENGVEVRWMEYANYPEYPQLHPPFEHSVTVLDLLFNVGADAQKYMKSFAQSLHRW